MKGAIVFNIFSEEAVNKGREIELDIARGIAVLFTRKV